MTYRPRQRTRDLASERIDCELVLIDTTTQRAHALNADHAAVWAACDGTRTIDQISSQLQLSRAQVDATVVELLDLELLEPDTAINRRALLTGTARIGGAAVVLTPIITIALPTAAAMASTVYSNIYYAQTAPNNYNIEVDGLRYLIHSGESTVIYVDAAGEGFTTDAGDTAPTTSPYLAFSLGSGQDLSVTFVIPNGLNGSASYTPDGGAVTPLSEGAATDLGTFTTANGTYSVHQT